MHILPGRDQLLSQYFVYLEPLYILKIWFIRTTIVSNRKNTNGVYVHNGLHRRTRLDSLSTVEYAEVIDHCIAVIVLLRFARSSW